MYSTLLHSCALRNLVYAKIYFISRHTLVPYSIEINTIHTRPSSFLFILCCYFTLLKIMSTLCYSTAPSPQCIHRLLLCTIIQTHPCSTLLHYTTLHYTTLHCTALHCTALHCTALHCTALHCTALHCTALHCTALHCTALHCTTLHYTILCSTLRYTVQSLIHNHRGLICSFDAPSSQADPYSTLLYPTLLYSTVVYSTVLCSALRHTIQSLIHNHTGLICSFDAPSSPADPYSTLL